MQYIATDIYDICSYCDGPCCITMERHDWAVDHALEQVQLGKLDPRSLIKIQNLTEFLD